MKAGVLSRGRPMKEGRFLLVSRFHLSVVGGDSPSPRRRGREVGKGVPLLLYTRASLFLERKGNQGGILLATTLG
eukprot:scaffold289549_cov30-Tisochrysis_lutea.AAC.1